jgi:hypothetical protein
LRFYILSAWKFSVSYFVVRYVLSIIMSRVSILVVIDIFLLWALRSTDQGRVIISCILAHRYLVGFLFLVFFEPLQLTQISIQSPCERTIPWHCLAEVDLIVPGCCHGDLGWGEGVRNSGQYAYLHRAALGNILADMQAAYFCLIHGHSHQGVKRVLKI